MRLEKLFLSCTAVVVAVLAGAPPAYGHGMHLFAAVEGQAIQGNLTFADGTPGREVLLTITGQTSGTKAQVTTDEQGEFEFEPGAREDFLIEAQTRDGHYARYTVPASELPESLVASTADDSSESVAATETANVDLAQIEHMVEESVSRQVAPLRRDLAAYRESVRLHDIIGGIGYILGLAGLWALWKSRSAKENRT